MGEEDERQRVTGRLCLGCRNNGAALLSARRGRTAATTPAGRGSGPDVQAGSPAWGVNVGVVGAYKTVPTMRRCVSSPGDAGVRAEEQAARAPGAASPGRVTSGQVSLTSEPAGQRGPRVRHRFSPGLPSQVPPVRREGFPSSRFRHAHAHTCVSSAVSLSVAGGCSGLSVSPAKTKGGRRDPLSPPAPLPDTHGLGTLRWGSVRITAWTGRAGGQCPGRGFGGLAPGGGMGHLPF